MRSVTAYGQPGPGHPARPPGISVRSLLGMAWAGPDPRALRAAVDGRIVLITGASSGIGEATARKVAAAGGTVLLVARTASRLNRVAKEITAAGGRAHVHPADVSDVDAVERLVTEVLAEHGHVDVVVNNAGKSIRRSVELSYDRFHDYTRTINVNYLGPVRLMLGLLPEMRRRRTGHLVNVSTVGVDLQMPHWSAYTASKNAFETWLRTVSPEARADGVTTSSIHFPLVHTAMSAPTPLFRRLPGMSAEEAGDVVCRAIVERPRLLSPWWSRAFGLIGDALPGSVDAALTLYCRMETALGRYAAATAAPSGDRATPAATEAPTTEAPKTEAPTTEAPTTEAPTAVAPTRRSNGSRSNGSRPTVNGSRARAKSNGSRPPRSADTDGGAR